MRGCVDFSVLAFPPLGPTLSLFVLRLTKLNSTLTT